MALYEKLWRPTIQRPWTYAMRQAAQMNPARVVIGAILTGVAVGVTAVWLGVLVCAGLAAGFLMGSIYGHLFWDTEGAYIKHKADFEK